MLHAWKFGNDRGLYRLFLPELQHRLGELHPEIQRFGYIGSGRSRFQVRSYQPCLDICRGLSAGMSLGFGADVMKRKRGRQSSRGYAGRFFDSKDAFRVQPPQVESYLLVEDVFTTGASANEAARMLKKSGVAKVYVVSLLMREDLVPDL